MSDSDIIQIQRDLIADFAVFDNWLDRYQYLVDLGRQLAPFPDRWKTEALCLRNNLRAETGPAEEKTKTRVQHPSRRRGQHPKC